MIPARFLSPAEWEMVQAARYYESNLPLLGSEFLSEVKRVVKGIETHPEAAPKVKGDIRRRVLRRFPYAILYQVDPDEIVILAVMHQRRQPDYWHGRI
jgi:plasmid stabilization system protein ParE